MTIPHPGAIGVDSVAGLVEALIGIPSVNPAYDAFAAGENQLASAVGGFCRDIGCVVRFEPVVAGRQNLIARLPAARPSQTLLIEVHLDTVGLPAGETVPRARRDGGRVFGRGACDVKGGLAAVLLAMTELAASPPDHLDVVLLGAVDEEHHFRGISGFLDMNTTPDLAVVVEPTELEIANEHNGVLRMELVVRGQSGHTSRHGQGRSAIRDAATVMQRLEQWHADLMSERGDSRGVLTFTTIEGGSGINVVPEICRIGLDLRMAPAEDPRSMTSILENQLIELAAEGVTVAVGRVLLADGGMSTPVDHPLVRSGLAAAGRGEPVWVPFGTDGSKLARAGSPTIVFGPGSIVQAHGDDEWVDVDDVICAATVFVDLVRQLDSQVSG